MYGIFDNEILEGIFGAISINISERNSGRFFERIPRKVTNEVTGEISEGFQRKFSARFLGEITEEILGGISEVPLGVNPDRIL